MVRVDHSIAQGGCESLMSFGDPGDGRLRREPDPQRVRLPLDVSAERQVGQRLVVLGEPGAADDRVHQPGTVADGTGEDAVCREAEDELAGLRAVRCETSAGLERDELVAGGWVRTAPLEGG